MSPLLLAQVQTLLDAAQRYSPVAGPPTAPIRNPGATPAPDPS